MLSDNAYGSLATILRAGFLATSLVWANNIQLPTGDPRIQCFVLDEVLQLMARPYNLVRL